MKTAIAEARRQRREALAQAVLARYRDGETVDAIARSMRSARVSVGQVRTLLREAGVSMRSEKRARGNVFVEMYQSGLLLSEIATRCTVSPQTVRNALKAGGVSIDSRDREASSLTRSDTDVMVAYYESGATMEYIGRIVTPPISRERVRQLLSKAGIITGGTGRKDDPVVFMSTLRDSETRSWKELATATGGNLLRAQTLALNLGVLDAAQRLLRMRRQRHSRKVERRVHNALQIPVDEMRAMRAAGKTWPEIAQFAGCCVASARIHVHPDGSGDTRARTGQEKLPLPLEKMREMRAQGFLDGEIAKRVGCSIGTVRNRIGLRKPR